MLDTLPVLTPPATGRSGPAPRAAQRDGSAGDGGDFADALRQHSEPKTAEPSARPAERPATPRAPARTQAGKPAQAAQQRPAQADSRKADAANQKVDDAKAAEGYASGNAATTSTDPAAGTTVDTATPSPDTLAAWLARAPDGAPATLPESRTALGGAQPAAQATGHAAGIAPATGGTDPGAQPGAVDVGERGTAKAPARRDAGFAGALQQAQDTRTGAAGAAQATAQAAGTDAAAAMPTAAAAKPAAPAADPGVAALPAGWGATAPTTAAHTAAAPTTVALPTPPDSPDFQAALSAQVSVLARDGVHEARIDLHPADMGPISVHIAMDGTAARVDFQAEVAATRQAIEASLPALAGALRDAGLTLAGGGVFQHGGRDAAANGQPTGRGGRVGGTADADGPVIATTARQVHPGRGLLDVYV